MPATVERPIVGIHAEGEALLNAVPGAVVVCDLEGQVITGNDAFAELTGKQRDGIAARQLAEFFAREFRSVIDEAVARAAAGHRVKDIRVGCVTSRGAMIPVSLASSRLGPVEEEAPLILVSLKDSAREEQLSEELSRTQSESESLLAELDEAYQRLKKAQDDLVRKERLAVSTEMAASVAHEIRNPLAIIMMSVQYLHSKLSPGHALREFTSVICNKVKQLDQITAQLIDYGRPRTLKLEARDLHGNLDQVLCLAKSKCTAQRIRVIKRFDHVACKVTCDHDLMDQVFSNLLMNAIQAMPKGGVLTVATQYDLPNNQALVHVSDTGRGIPRHVQPQLPKPFFTTKRDGTGLGLAISHRIVEHHHGSLTYTSLTRGPQRGTTFTIKMPITPPQERSLAE